MPQTASKPVNDPLEPDAAERAGSSSWRKPPDAESHDSLRQTCKSQYRAIKPEIDAAIQRVLDSAQFILGDEVTAFEREFAAFCGTRRRRREHRHERACTSRCSPRASARATR